MISKTSEYALRAVTCLAAEFGRPLSADNLAKTTKVPRRYLTRVMQDLATAEMVVSRSGPGGGYELAVTPAELTLLDVIDAVSPLQRITSCPLGIKSHKKLCPLHAELDRAYAETETAFSNVTIQQLIDSKSTVTPLCQDKRP